MPALDPGRKTVAELARWTPAQLMVWRLRRLVKASYRKVQVRVEWWGQEALHTVPPPQDGPLLLVGDGSEKPKRGTPPPPAQKGRKSEHPPGFVGMRLALLIVNWEG
jgi:hypothetical protein